MHRDAQSSREPLGTLLIPLAVSDESYKNGSENRTYRPDHVREWCCSNCNPALNNTGIRLDIGEMSVKECDDQIPQLEEKIREWLQS